MYKSIRLLPIFLALVILVGACLPQQAATQSPAEIEGQVATSVAQTVQAKDQIATYVAMTVDAQNTATALAQSQAQPQLTEPPAQLPFASPAFTATPFVIVPSGGGGGGGGTSSQAQYSCSWREVYPKFNKIKAGQDFDVVWVITNTGTKTMHEGLDLDYVNGPKLSPFLGQELPMLKPGDTVTISFVATAPTERGFYGMQFKVEGGLCWPALNIQVGEPNDP